jgi:cellulose synthase/poly-beta-1,6-N-acetylglucosamine synthase-like glycosyltransferase
MFSGFGHVAIAHPVAVAVLVLEAVFFGYFVVSNIVYLATTIASLRYLPGFVKLHLAQPVRPSYSPLEYPVSVLVPAYNEEEGIIDTVTSLLHLDYVEYEVLVINDGSTDRTLELLTEHFELEPFPEAYRVALTTERVKTIYRSAKFRNLRVIDKANGGKADALNAGINGSRYPLVFACDGDSYYSRDALQCLIEPFVNDATTVVTAGGIGISNDCEFKDGLLTRIRLSKNWLVRFQVVEYLRAFLSSRLGWAPLNALASVSGACGLWRKDVIVQAGGYRTDTIWEDLEMTLRVHHMLSKQGRKYRIAFTPFNVCWTRVPDTVCAFWKQRVAWHRHLSECVTIHRGMVGDRRTGVMGWLSLPYLIVVEWIAPVMVLLGLAFGFAAAWLGILSWSSQYVLLALILALELLVSAAAIFLDEISFNTYDVRELFMLICASLFEAFGFRQLACVANFGGLVAWITCRPIRGRRDVPSWNVARYEPTVKPT